MIGALSATVGAGSAIEGFFSANAEVSSAKRSADFARGELLSASAE
jgi:hypothetical protein